MNDLISREETISYIENWKEVNKYYHPYTKNTNIPIDEVIQIIKDVPSNNQKIGHWIEKNVNQDGTHNIYCSNCNNYLKFKGHANSYNARTKLKYCPNCGAKMEENKE
jgi:Pyruvate/2-oxoacid:ferredoxin oxidoreductase delta subunit